MVRPLVVLFGSPLFCRHFGCFGVMFLKRIFVHSDFRGSVKRQTLAFLGLSLFFLLGRAIHGPIPV